MCEEKHQKAWDTLQGIASILCGTGCCRRARRGKPHTGIRAGSVEPIGVPAAMAELRDSKEIQIISCTVQYSVNKDSLFFNCIE